METQNTYQTQVHNSSENKGRVVVLGGGESGNGAAILAKKLGFEVFLSDKGSIKEHYKNQLLEYQIPFEELQHTESLILNADVVIKSPGIPEKAPLIQLLRSKNTSIISEIEFASRYTDAKIIAITGSNGKTTTTSLIFHMMKQNHINVGLGGNIGKSFAYQVATENFDYYVLEISSFQLDDVTSFAPYIAVVLNISPDHLDRYQYDIMNYAKAKWNLTKYQTNTDFVIYWEEDTVLQQLQQEFPTQSKAITFSTQNNNAAAYADEEHFTINLNNEILDMNISELALSGKHNVANSMAAASVGKVLQIKNENIRMALSDFEAVEHRLEPVLKIQGIQFINDSKATNVNAVYYALESMKTPTVLILGGEDKGNDYNEILDLVKQKVKAIVCLGKDNTIILDFFSNIVDVIVDTHSMEEAVKSAYMLARKGDTVLLAPACASFDLFENYEDRGTQFKQHVRNL